MWLHGTTPPAVRQSGDELELFQTQDDGDGEWAAAQFTVQEFPCRQAAVAQVCTQPNSNPREV
jgi:hypothetical protein